jgi:IclR family acetate operon transcriptional repressor
VYNRKHSQLLLYIDIVTTIEDIEQASASLRSLAILEVVVKADRPISLAEIVDKMALPKPTVFRLLSTLEKVGWVLRQPGDKDYTVGSRLARFGLDVMTNNSVRAIRHAILANIAGKLGETCNITMLDGNEVVYIDRVESQWPLKVDLQPGTRVPLHCSASGKLFLSQMRQSKRRGLLDNLILNRFTDHTITNIDLLESELDRTRNNQIGIDNQEYLDGLICVAVPINDVDGQIAAVLAVQAPTARLTLARAMEHVPSLRAAANAMAETFSSSGCVKEPVARQEARKLQGVGA